MSGRSEVAAYLAMNLPEDWKVYPYQRNLDGISKVTVMVQQTSVRPGIAAGSRVAAVQVAVVVPQQDPAKVDDALEDAMEEALPVIESIPRAVFGSADRDVLQEAFNAYIVNIEIPVNKNFKEN